VSDNGGARLAEMADQTDNIIPQQIPGITSDFLRLITQIVAPLVRHSNAVAQFRERFNLLFPAKPEFREPVQQNNQWPVFRPCNCRMHPDAVRLNVLKRYIFHSINTFPCYLPVFTRFDGKIKTQEP